MNTNNLSSIQLQMEGNNGTTQLAVNYVPDTTVTYPTALTYLRMRQIDQHKVHISYADFLTSYEANAITSNTVSEDNTHIMQRHDNFELMLVINGVVGTLIEEGEFQFSKGDAYLLNRNTKNKLYYQEESDCIALCISKEYLRDLATDTTLTFHHKLIQRFIETNTFKDSYDNKDYIEFRCIKNTDIEKVQDIYFRIYEELRRKDTGSIYIIRGLLLRLLKLMDTPSQYAVTYVDLGPSQNRDIAEGMKKYMEDCKRIVTREELSSHFHYSVGYLSRIFKKHHGSTIKNFNQKIYMEEARRLTIHSSMSISKIAQEVGFSNRTQFYTLFKKTYGTTPHCYRLEYQHE